MLPSSIAHTYESTQDRKIQMTVTKRRVKRRLCLHPEGHQNMSCMTSSSSRLTEQQRHLFSAASESIFSCNIRRTCHLSPRPPCCVLAFDSVAEVLQGKGDVFCSPVLFAVPEGSDAGGENHEWPGFQQGQRGGFQRVCCAGGCPDRCLQRLLPRAE